MKERVLGLRQKGLRRHHINMPQTFILSYILSPFIENKEKIHTSTQIMCPFYSQIIKDLPIMGIKTPGQIGRLLGNLERSGILHMHFIKTKEGTNVIINFTETFLKDIM